MITVSQSGIVALLLFLTVALVGCDAASDPEGSAALGKTSPFKEEDLARIIPRPSEPPEGMRFSGALRGEPALRRLPATPSADLRQSLVGGRLVAGLEREFQHADGSLVQAGGLLFKNRDASLRLFQELAIDYGTLQEVEEGIERPRALSHVSLGEESFGARGSLAPLSPRESVVLFVWRQRNLVLYVRAFGVTGTPESADEVLARHLAEAMDAEASP